MNILHLTKDYIHLNGISTFIKFLVLNDNTHEHFIASNCITKDCEQSQNKNIIKQVLPIGTFQFVQNMKRLVNICKENKIDIIHSHHRWYDLLAYFVSKIYHIKTITTVHSKVYGKKILSYKADKIVVVGESIKKHLIRYFGINENRIIVINNFIDPDKIELTKDKKEIKSELDLNDKYVLGFVGRFDIEEKGIDILIDAIPNVLANYPNAAFVFIGDGKDKNYLKNNTGNFIDKILIVETKLDIYNYIQVFDQIILPSRIDPFPLVMLEAAYLKIPIIGSNVDGISEFVDDGINGLLFTPDDHVDLSNKIISLINDKDKAKLLGERLNQKVINNFTAEKIVPQYDDLYKSVLMK